MVSSALVAGITGQHGKYHVEPVLSKGCLVHGLVRRSEILERLEGFRDRATLIGRDLLGSFPLLDAWMNPSPGTSTTWAPIVGAGDDERATCRAPRRRLESEGHR